MELIFFTRTYETSGNRLCQDRQDTVSRFEVTVIWKKVGFRGFFHSIFLNYIKNEIWIMRLIVYNIGVFMLTFSLECKILKILKMGFFIFAKGLRVKKFHKTKYNLLFGYEKQCFIRSYKFELFLKFLTIFWPFFVSKNFHGFFFQHFFIYIITGIM